MTTFVKLPREAQVVERTVECALSESCPTADIARAGERVLSAHEMADEILVRT